MRERDRHGQRGDPANVVLAEACIGDPAHLRADLRVIAELGMVVERQMVGEQVQVIGQQQFQAPVFAAGNLRRLVAPEVAVMDQHGVGTPVERSLQKRQ